MLISTGEKSPVLKIRLGKNLEKPVLKNEKKTLATSKLFGARALFAYLKKTP